MTMIQTFALYLLIWATDPIPQTDESIDLYEAVAKKMISVSPVGKGGYQGNCILLTYNNLTGYRLNVKVPAGTMFNSVDEDVQDLMVTQEALLAVGPKQQGKAGLFTMCTQASNAGPGTGEAFELGAKADKYLLQLAEVIARNDYQNSTAQSAVWAVASNSPTAWIYGESRKMVEDLCGVVSQMTGKPCEQQNFEPRPHSISSIRTSIEVLIPDYLQDVRLNVYHADGRLFRQYFAGHAMKPGFVQIKTGVHHVLGDSAKFIVRLESEKGVLSEKTVAITDTVTALQKMGSDYKVVFDMKSAVSGIRMGIYDDQDRLHILLKDNGSLQLGMNALVFNQLRDLPKGGKYVFKAKKGNEVLVERPLSYSELPNSQFPRVVRRGMFSVKLKDPVANARMTVEDEGGEVVWVVFDKSHIAAGDRQIPYTYEHNRGPETPLFLKLYNSKGELLKKEQVNPKK